MKILTLENFKAFLSKVDIDFNSKNAMIYGENGSGKSSIYEAIKLWFYTDRVFDCRCNKALTSPADIQNDKNDILNSYNHQKSPGTRFDMTMNGVHYSSSTSPVGYNVCMIDRTDIEVGDCVELIELLGKVLVGIDNPSTFITNKRQDIIDFINLAISTEFSEPNIEVDLSFLSHKWFLTIKDKKRQFSRSHELPVYYNEGKLHIIILVFLLIAAQLNGKTEPNKILVLDDVITSLDAANRTFLIKYIHNYFEDWQKIIMTHSSSFFNQMDSSFRKIWLENDKWKSFRVQEYEEESSIIEIDNLYTGNKLRNIYRSGIRRGTLPASLPNDIRKRFEYLVSELSGLLSIGGIVEASQILNAINKQKDYYFYYDVTSQSIRTIFDMVEEIISKIAASPVCAVCTLKTDLETIINKYKSGTELTKLHTLLQSLMIYQKVTMHAGSHSTGAITPLTSSEMDRCIILIQDLERLMGKLVKRDMYSI